MTDGLSRWPPASLGDVIRVKHGFAFDGQFFSDAGHYIVVTPGNFRESGGFKPKSGREKFYAAVPRSEYILRKGDLVVAMTEQAQGLLGSSALIPADNTYLHNQRIGLIEIEARDRIDKLFLYYLFNTAFVRGQLQSTATGTKIRHTAPSRIEAVQVPLPPLGTQRKIASILSAYDDLIENNTRRIQILEELAQRIYHEWFVDFRYPDHQGVPMVDSELGPIPEGWEVRRIDSVAAVNGRTARGRENGGQITYIDIASVSTGRVDELTILDFAQAPGRARRLVQDGDIIWSTVRPNRKSYALLIDPPHNCIVSTGFAVLTATHVPYSYLYHFVTTDSFTDYLVNHATGSAYPAVTGKAFEDAPVVVPPSRLLDGFHTLVSPLLILAANLHRTNATLRAARDLLLPRLISGEIDVEHLDIDTSGLAA